MSYKDTSKEAFDGITVTGARETLEQMVFAAVLMIGPVHNLRLLEYLQQREKQRPKKHRITWTTNNAWPRVTQLVALGRLRDLGTFRGVWCGRKKTLHFWAAGGQSETDIEAGWEKVKKRIIHTPGVPEGATQKALF